MICNSFSIQLAFTGWLTWVWNCSHWDDWRRCMSSNLALCWDTTMHTLVLHSVPTWVWMWLTLSAFFSTLENWKFFPICRPLKVEKLKCFLYTFSTITKNVFNNFICAHFGKQNLINLSQFSRFIVIFFISFSSFSFIFYLSLFYSNLKKLEMQTVALELWHKIKSNFLKHFIIWNFILKFLVSILLKSLLSSCGNVAMAMPTKSQTSTPLCSPEAIVFSVELCVHHCPYKLWCCCCSVLSLWYLCLIVTMEDTPVSWPPHSDALESQCCDIEMGIHPYKGTKIYSKHH